MIAAIFPGQGSKKPGMGTELFDEPQAMAVVSQIRSAVGLDLRQLCLESDEETLRQTQNAQMALFGCGVLAFACIKDALKPVAMGVTINCSKLFTEEGS